MGFRYLSPDTSVFPTYLLLYYGQMTRQALEDSNRYLRDKLRLAYKEKNLKYDILLKQWQNLLYHSKVQQDEIDYLNRQLGKTKMRKW